MGTEEGTDTEAAAGGPVRVIEAQLPDRLLSEQLFGPGVQAERCRLVFKHMLPVADGARVSAVLPHGLSLSFEDGESLLVPWGQVSYVTREG